jgi:hypothetical protein
MLRFIVTIFVVCISFITYAQLDFRPGYVVIDGDTLSGLVDFKEGAWAFRECSFRKSAGAEIISYLPDDITAYGFVGDKAFQSREVKVSGVAKSVFMELVVKGTVSLFKREDEYWVEKDGIGLHQLVNNVKQVDIGNDRTKQRYDNLHIATLNRMMYDCPGVKNSVEHIELSKRSLTNLVENYNKCVGDIAPTVYQSKKPWIAASVGFIMGANFSQLRIASASAIYDDLEGPSDWETSVLLGPTLDVLAPRTSEHLSFTTAILYLSTKYHSHNQRTQPIRVDDDYLTVDIQQLKFPIGIKYTFTGKKIAPYINGGVAFAAHLASDVKWTEIHTYPDEVLEYNKKPFAIKSGQAGYWGGIGINTAFSKALTGVIELRMDYTDGITPSNSQTVLTRIMNYEIMIGIRMK